MKKYDLGIHPMIDELINNYNINNNQGNLILSSSGLLINTKYEFSAVVEYYELEKDEELYIGSIQKDIIGSIILADKLSLPLYIIVYKENNEYFSIYDYFQKNRFNKSFVLPSKESEFISWWKTLKGTVQVKPFYKNTEENYKINSILLSAGYRWGGDIDGFIVNKERKITSILEFRKSTKINVGDYDPKKYYSGYYNRAGDYHTWKPLIKLKNELNVPLYLITMSELNGSIYGGTEVKNATPNDLIYKNDISPNSNLNKSIVELIESLYGEERIDE